MSWPDVAETDDGYKQVTNKVKGENDIWWSDSITLESCKAACNSTSQCKSIAYGNNGGTYPNQCWLKKWTESDGNSNDNNWTTYYKQGEPANDKRMYITKGINTVTGKDWKQVGSLYERNGKTDRNDCDMASKKVGSAYEYYDRNYVGNKYNFLCTRIPRSSEMCPNLGPDTGNKDLRYFIHDAINSSKVGDLDFSNYSNDRVFTQTGTTLNSGDNVSIRCGYNRIDKQYWPRLGEYFDDTTKAKIIKEHCEGPGITSKELAADSQYCGNTTYFSKSEYYQAILNKLKNESNWWNDKTNCDNFQSVVTGNTNDQAVMRIASEVIDALPSTGWSDDLVRALNALKGSGNVPDSVKSMIDPKIINYCSSSNGNTNPKCACYNAATKGKSKTCTKDIIGCDDVKRYTDLIEKARNVNQTFGAQMELIYDPNSQSDSCQTTKLTTSNILRYGYVGDNKLDVAACFNEFENSGTIGGSVSSKCDIAVKNYQTSGSSGGGGGSSSSSSGSDSEGTIIKGSTGGVKNDYWLVVLCLCCMCFLIIGVGLAAFLI